MELAIFNIFKSMWTLEHCTHAWKYAGGLNAVAVQFHFSGSKRLKPVPSGQCCCAQSELQEGTFGINFTQDLLA